ncbi:MAG TPA: phosphatase PAP2 family protein [Ilumatobacteraceae bacterium]|nr:phosphatase PAP2 family protein [Ilumatobacteraceae bacterium]
MSGLTQFDAWGDEQLERLRGNPVADSVFHTASHIGDFSAIWHVIGIGRAVVDPSKWRQSMVMSALIGAESLIVNQGVKRLFRRVRPTETGDPRYPVRRPLTSSFPSGHASAAFFSAALLTTATGRSLAPIWYSTAAVVALSRAYVRIHHLSDVVGGVAVGVVCGVAGSRLLVALTP